MYSDSLYLGFDAGTQSVKVAAYNGRHECLAQSIHSTTIYNPGPNMVEMDVDEYRILVERGLRECVKTLIDKGYNPDNIRSVMGDGIICGIACIDSAGNPITRYINYLDSRTQPYADSINSLHNDIWRAETGNAEASCMFPAVIAEWFLDNIPDVKLHGAKFVHNAPYVLMHLAGVSSEDAFIDQGTMSGWGLGYRVTEKEWSGEQLDILGIPKDMMPRIVKPWDIIGGITKEVSDRTGVPEGTPVCAGAGDTMQSMIGCGSVKPGTGVDVAGTCAMFCLSTDGIIPELSRAGSGLIFNSGSLDNTYFYWGYIRTGGLALKWFRNNVVSEDYDTLNTKASEVPPGSGGVVFLPYLTGGVGDMAGASGCFLNMGLDTDRYVMWRAVLESIGYDYMRVADLCRSAGADLSRITIAEGGSVNNLWNGIKADMLGCRADVMEVTGGAVLTDCIMGAYAVGDTDSLEPSLKSAVRVERSFEPDPDRHSKYVGYARIREYVFENGMKKVYRTLSELR